MKNEYLNKFFNHMSNIKYITHFKIFLFLVLFFVAIFYPKNMFDYIISDMIRAIFGGGVFSFLAKMISYIFHDKLLLLFMGCLGIFLLVIKEYKKSIFILSVAFFGALSALIIKYLIQRERPLPNIFDGYSFPSGHSTVVALFFLSLIFIISKKELLKKIMIFAFIAVPVSRVIIGAHYITDVLGGLLLGSIIVDLMKIYYLPIYKKFIQILGIKDEKK